MKQIGVVFPNSSKVYVYQTELKLIRNGIYDITVDEGHTYTSFVKVLGPVKTNYDGYIRTITKARLVEAPPRKNSRIQKVYINKKKKTVTILWVDNTNTTVTCQNGDTFDEEKGILACYMKRFFENRGYYNEIIKDAIKNAERV